MSEFRDAANKLVFGENTEILPKLATMQTVSGTGSLQMGFKILRKFTMNKFVYVTDPTWSLHGDIIQTAGFDPVKLPWFDRINKRFDFEGYLQSIKEL